MDLELICREGDCDNCICPTCKKRGIVSMCDHCNLIAGRVSFCRSYDPK